MTIQFDASSNMFTLAHSGNVRTVGERTLQRLANANEWGDIETTMQEAKRNPRRAFTVDNRPRVKHALGFYRA